MSLGEIIERHKRIVLQFSGGKDSLATLYLARPWWNRLLVVWVNTGDAFPETIAQMREIRALVPNFFEARSDQPAHIEKEGWPADVVPVEATTLGRLLRGADGPLMQAYPLCCGHSIWAPMQAVIASYGATLVIRGTRKDDARRGRESPGDIINGVEYSFPLWERTSAQVMEWLRKHNVQLPPHYRFTKTSLDCQHCTAYLDENAEKMRYLADFHPNLSAEIQRRLNVMRGLIVTEAGNFTKAIL